MICPFCKSKAVHSGDHDYEDYGIDDEGIVSNGICINEECEVDLILVYRKIEDEIRDE
tara:strand:- start:2561 stop:2734 length:174 start_codon:yes stop_codon:yes gene_type:complete